MTGITSPTARDVRQDDPVRIMCVGDSMTIGSAGDFTWRYRLWQRLRHSGVALAENARFVGPRHALHEDSENYGDPSFPVADRAHLAGWGEGWLHMADNIGDAVRDHRPDTLLISLGLIDLGFYTDAEQTAVNVRRFFGAARAAQPTLRAVLLPVIPNVRATTDALFAAQCALFNDLLSTAVAELSSPRSPLLLAPTPHGYTLEVDTYDGTHPSASGEHRIAETFARALCELWELGLPTHDPLGGSPAPERAAQPA